MVKLDAAARALGFHVETLRVRIRRGDLAAIRGPHGAYYLAPSVVATLQPPRRSGRRALAPESLEWTWLALAQRADQEGASHSDLLAMRRIQADPTLSRSLHRLFTVHRLRLADLTSAEIADLTGLTRRHVRRVARKSLKRALSRGLHRKGRDLYGEGDDDEEEYEGEEEDDDDDGLSGLDSRLSDRVARRNLKAARVTVAGLQRRLEAAGFSYHKRPRKKRDKFTPKRRAPAYKAYKLHPEVIWHLLDGGLSDEQVSAIQLAGIGQDELNELILNGLPKDPEQSHRAEDRQSGAPGNEPTHMS